jgi:hypothetical protein
MAIFTCPCGKQLKAKDEDAGRRTKCPDCGQELTIPGPDEAVRPAAEPGRSGPRRRFEDEGGLEEYEAGERRGRRYPQETSGKAVASLVLGILSFCLPVFASIAAIILGIVGLSNINQSQGRLKGRGLAIAGIVTGAISPFIMVPLMLFALLLPAVQKVREASSRAQSANNLKQLALAMHMYHDKHARLPPAVVYDKNGKPLYSWRVLLLPYLGQDALYRRFKLDEPWDSPNNKALLPFMPAVFASPRGVTTPEPYSTFYQVFVGPGAAFETDVSRYSLRPFPLGGPGAFEASPVITLTQFTDGTMNTFLIVEAGTAVPWTKPADLAFEPLRSLPPLGTPGGNRFVAAFADGSVRSIQQDADEKILRALITRNGNETVSPGDVTR